MSRLLFLIAIAVVVFLLIKSYKRGESRQGKPVVDDMVRCSQCGVHVPKSESVQSGGRYFCCAEHRDAFTK